LGISKDRYYKILKSEEYRTALTELSDEATKEAVATFKASMAELIHEAHRVIREQLKENNLEAVKLVMKGIGVEQVVENQQQSNIQVILPDYNQAKPVDVEVK
jgi:hypothetical protein